MIRRVAAAGFVSAVLVAFSNPAAAQMECSTSPDEVAIPAEVVTATAGSVGSLSKPDQDTTDEETFDDQILGLLTLDRVAFVVDDGVIATASTNVDMGPQTYTYQPSSGDDGVPCFPAAENDDLDLAFLRCDGDLGDPITAGNGSARIGDAVLIAGGQAGVLATPDPPRTGMTYEVVAGAMPGTPVVDAEGHLVGIAGNGIDPIIDVTGQILACGKTPIRTVDDLGDGVEAAAGLPSTYGMTMATFLGFRAAILGGAALVLAAIRNRLRGYPIGHKLVGWCVLGIVIASSLTGIQYVAGGVAGRTW